MPNPKKTEVRALFPSLFNPWRFGIQGFLGALFLVLLFAATLSLSWIGYRVVTSGVERIAVKRSDALARTVVRELSLSFHGPIHSFLDWAAHIPLERTDTLKRRIEYLPMAYIFLKANSFAGGMLVGYGNGDFLFIRLLNSEDEKLRYNAPPGSVLMAFDVRGDFRPSRASVLFFNGELTRIGKEELPGLNGFDPRIQEWYVKAMSAEGHVDTGPFFFADFARPGIVLSEKSFFGEAVIGISVYMEQVSAILNDDLPTPGSRIALFNAARKPVASADGIISEPDRGKGIREIKDFSPIIRRAMELYEEGKRGGDLGVHIDGRDWLVSLEDLKQEFSMANYVLAVAIPRDELIAESEEVFLDYLIMLAGLLALTVTLMWMVTYSVGRPLRALIEQTRTPALNSKPHPQLASGVKEIRALAKGVGNIRDDLRKVLTLLNMIGTERDMSRLLEQVIKEIVRMVDVHGGVLILWDGQTDAPVAIKAFWKDADVDDMTLPARNQSPNLITYKALEQGRVIKSTILRGDPRASLGPLTPSFIDPSVARIDIICVPLYDRVNQPLGVFTLANRIAYGQELTESFSTDTTDFIGAIARIIGIVLETQTLIDSQRNLRDALIHILAGAIDTKSPYTGGHCARVPVIFQLLLQAAHDADKGKFKDFALDENGWETARLAAWLHDCGKVTTPEYVVDKATKLETLYDRIHEIRTRFEVLKRDAELDSLRAVLAGADREEERLRLADALRLLDDDFAFVASCNAGEESMDGESAARLASIGRRTWMRTLDKRLGVSREERLRMEHAGAGAPPARETLLADQPEHVIPRREKDRFPDDGRWGAKVAMPEALYNRGELYNLLIPWGTLTKEERYKINDHITKTITMLNMLPLPEELAEVPKIAGAHHERIDGGGYPCGLTGSDMDWPARMLVIADIFEALTASDRPYKSSKKLSEALRIMNGMKANKHIDPDLYDLFIETGIPQRYAAEYLAPEQNDM